MAGTTFLRDIIELAVDIELEVAALYDTFARNFADDGDLCMFWRLYAEAERYHAATIRVHQAAFGSGEVVAEDSFPTEVDESRAFLKKLVDWRTRFTAAPATRAEAFAIARSIEHDASEIHGRTQFFRLYPRFRDLFTAMVEEDIGHRAMLDEAARRFTAVA